MKNLIIALKNKETIRYISNISPLLWTDDIKNAKKFISENEISIDLSSHKKSLELLTKEVNNPIEIISIDSNYD